MHASIDLYFRLDKEQLPFLQRAAMLALQALYYSYGNSVRLSVRPSHAGIVSK